MISFYLTKGNNIYHSTSSNGFGVNFSVSPNIQVNYEPINTPPQIEFDTMTPVLNFCEKFTYSFIATEPFEFITIGNFKNVSTTLLSDDCNEGACYFIDKIELYEFTDYKICKGDTVTINYAPSTGSGTPSTGSGIYSWADSLYPEWKDCYPGRNDSKCHVFMAGQFNSSGF